MGESLSWSEKIADRLEYPWVYVVALTVGGGLFLGLALYGIRHFHRTLDWRMALGCAVAAIFAWIAILVAGYTFVHAPVVFLPFALFLLLISFTEPRFGIGMALVIWGMAVKGFDK